MDRKKGKAVLFSRMKIRSATECWLWQGGTNGRYGHAHFEGKIWLIHRLSYCIYFGKIPKGHVVHHTCHNKLCGNPSHLVAILQAENNRLAESGFRKGEQNPNNRLTRDEVFTVKIMREVKGMSQKVIAEVTGFHRSTVNDICKGRTWNHISI